MSKKKKNKKKVRINFRDVDQLLENPVPLKPISFSVKINCKKCGLPGFLSIKAEGDGIVDIYLECPFCQNEEQIHEIEELDYGDECCDGEEIIEDFLTRDEPLTKEEEQREITERGYITEDPRKV